MNFVQTISQEKLINHVIQVVTSISPIVEGYQKNVKGVRKLTIPKRVIKNWNWLQYYVLFSWQLTSKPVQNT